MSQIGELGPADLGDIAGLCQRAIVDAPSRDELAGALFAPEQPAVVLGDAFRGVVALVECDDGPHVRLLAVDPSVRRAGHGLALLAAAEEWARSAGHRSLTTGADPPYFLWPGVPSTDTALICLLERRHYGRVDTNFNMRVDLGSIPADPGGHALARAGERDEIDAWMATHWSNWRLEVLRALDRGNLVVARERDRDEGESGAVIAFCAFEVNRRGLLGPVAVRPDLIGQGCGKAALLGALHELRRRGRDDVSVVWVGPVAPYAAVGGQVIDVYFVYRKELL
jgi:GNAT superfamily N-acetyltransferase